MSQPAIELTNASIDLGGVTILKNVNLRINYGETVVFIGPSGEGKTVLLKMMTGLYKPTSGNVFIEGRSWDTLSAYERREQFKKVGMLFQKSALFDSISAQENITFPMTEHTNVPLEDQQTKAQSLLDAVGLGEATDKLPHELSGGMQRRLGIARALAMDPAILFYDDPTAGLDPVISDRIVKLIKDLKEKFDSTVVAVTNDIVSAFELADRVFLVAAQEVWETGTPEDTENSKDPRVQQFIHGELEGPLRPATL